MKKSSELPARCERLKHLRKKHKYTQNTIADKIGVTTKTYRTWEIGVFDADSNSQLYPLIDNEKLEKLSAIYNVSIDYLLGKTDITKIDSNFIHDKIGLSENSINVLSGFTESRFREKYIAIIDFLLAHEETRNLLRNIYYYFFGNYSKTLTDDFSIDLYDENFNDGVAISYDQMFVVFLSAVINALPTIKTTLIDNNDEYLNYGKPEPRSLDDLKKEWNELNANIDSINENDISLLRLKKQIETLEKSEEGSD